MNKKGWILCFSLVFNLIVIIVAIFIFVKLGGMSYVSAKLGNEAKYDENPHYVERMSLFKEVDIPKNAVIFVGDSMTQRGLWNELFPEQVIINRGINRDTTNGVNSRIDDIVAASPSKIFLMIGVNDISTKKTTGEIISNYQEILTKIKKDSTIDVYIQSLLPVNNELYGNGIDNNQVVEINEKLALLAQEFNYSYVDVYSSIASEKQLAKSFTSADGIHLNGQGYNQWKNVIKEFVEN